MAEYVYSGRIGFGQSTSTLEIERQITNRPIRPEWTLCAFDDGVLASKLAMLPFAISWNGREIGCGGVTAVTTLPTHRRLGYVGELMRRSFAIMRDANQPVAMLWATMSAIYQRFGYGNAFTNYLYDFDARGLRFVDTIATPGRTRLLHDVDAIAVTAPAYERFAAPRTLMLKRDPDWQARLRRSLEGKTSPNLQPLLVAVYEEGKDILGYAVFDVEDGRLFGRRRDQHLVVYDFVWLNPAAHRALIQLLGAYDLANSVRFTVVPTDDPLFNQVEEPRRLNGSFTDGTLLRIVDVRAALSGRGYDGDGRVHLGLVDELCPWNTGTWELAVDGNVVEVRATDAEPDFCLAPRALAMLAAGYQTATTLARQGLIVVNRTESLTSADNLFRTAYAPFCMDHF
jgi:predicted acetyltransferase